jgi:ferredoxin-type protein NapG
MDRRSFLKRTAQKTAEHAVESLESRIKQRARRWIRPPYAIDELDFLLACSRCGDCIDACPHGTVFPLKASLGADVVGTPALDLTNKACHLCEDWPCVNACATGALRLAETKDNTETRPMLATAQINTRECLPYKGPECGACEGSCPVTGALLWKDVRPVIDTDHCIGCGLCRESCILEPPAIVIQSRLE